MGLLFPGQEQDNPGRGLEACGSCPESSFRRPGPSEGREDTSGETPIAAQPPVTRYVGAAAPPRDVMTPALPPPPLSCVFLYNPGYSCGHFCGFSPIMASGVNCFRRLHPAFCTYLATLSRPVSEVPMKPVCGRQHDHRQYLAYPAVPVRQFATKKAKAKGKGQPQARVNINTALVEDIINLEEVDEEMKSVMEALKDNFTKTLNIRTAPEMPHCRKGEQQDSATFKMLYHKKGSLDHITVVTADGKLALNHIGQISMKSPQLILVNMAGFPECTAAAIKAIRESGMNLNPEVEGTLIRVPIPKVTREHREMLVKLAKQNTNKAKENLRKVRTNAVNKLKKSKDKASEDTIRLIEKQISQMADATVAELDRHLAAKTKELLG
ncbi:hypothetical protein STEG23_030991 [Scotinomys teguina]